MVIRPQPQRGFGVGQPQQLRLKGDPVLLGLCGLRLRQAQRLAPLLLAS
ncbi:hypothetical protein MAY82_02475 [Edwardsiella ictaluri]|nr:hypothetical protein [Edwardsiella ictaluri]WFO13235.1 hypothetical protein MAY82_02475 [Edwardsiella ictaluri]